GDPPRGARPLARREDPPELAVPARPPHRRVRQPDAPADRVMITPTPASLGYRMPGEWHLHASTWLTWPKDPVTWPDRVPQVQEIYLAFIEALTPHERVDLLVDDADVEADVRARCRARGVDDAALVCHHVPTA